jgi:hypothetical protein
MSEATDARLQRLLGGDHLASLRQRLRRRFERAPLGKPVEHVRIGRLTADEHTTLPHCSVGRNDFPAPWASTFL